MFTVRVCDAAMGSGKSSAAITYINSHPSWKFIYITPYLSEANRIKENCPAMHFIEPSNKLQEFHFKKSEHTASLISEGRNIATTHQAFRGYNYDMLDEIRRQEYVLIIDENVEVLESFEFDLSDLQLAVDAGYIKEENGIYTRTDKAYNGKAYSELFGLLKTRELTRMSDQDDKALFYWALPSDLITSFKEVFILTYLFEGQSIHHFLQIYNIPYEYIGIHRSGDNIYSFGEYPGYIPDYMSHLGDMLHILDNDKLNQIGNNYHALSMNWYKRGGKNIAQLKKNISNYFNNIQRDLPAKRRLWGSYNDTYSMMRGKGYSNSFLTFNAKAMNSYRDKDCLVYITNLFMSVNEKKFYQMHGIEIDEDIYALSIMVQWIWRSAIRDGAEVYLYIPSRRMRQLLKNWINSLSEGGVST